MANRLGLLSPSELTAEQVEIQSQYHAYAARRYPGNRPMTHLADGTLVGPYGIVIHHPAVARAFLATTQALATVPGLSVYAREVVIAVLGARFACAYENYAHDIIAQRVGLTAVELAQIHAGVCPESLTEEGRAAFEVATALVERRGPLDQGVWDRAVGVLGTDGAAAAVHYAGFYAYVGIVMNGFDTKIPDGADEDRTAVE